MVEVVANAQLKQRYRLLQIVAGGFALSFVMMSLLVEFLPILGVDLPLFALSLSGDSLRLGLGIIALGGWLLSTMLRNSLLSLDEKRTQRVEEVLVPGARYARLYRAELIRMAVIDGIATLGFVLALLTGSSLDCHIAVVFSLMLLLGGFPRYHEWERWNSQSAVFR